MRIVTGVAHCPQSKDRESVIAEYHGMHTYQLSHHTNPVIVPTPYSVLHNSQLRHIFSNWYQKYDRE